MIKLLKKKLIYIITLNVTFKISYTILSLLEEYR